MGAKGDELASKLEQANQQMIETVERISPEQWQKTTSGEGWTVGVAAHHVAASTSAVAGLVGGLANGQPLPQFTMDDLNAGNAQHAREFANCTKAETLDLLRKDGANAAAMLRGLSDEQLARSGTLPALGQETTAAQLAEMILIGHPQMHLASIQAAIA